jgi:hypothetical protein
MKEIRVPLDGLGMSRASMLELVSRMNANDDRKWVLIGRSEYYGQLANPYFTQYQQQLAGIFAPVT